MKKETTTLTFQEGVSNKFYTISVEKTGSTFDVPFTFGRIGTAGQNGFKVQGASYEEAKKAYDKTINEKTKKGYQVS